ncbi:hypothetical protein MAQ5080_01089 [Marinomonas aquimarina]|uniref:ATPase AAA-type core domain-containing protein n=1 Tax=Marinomonas aquimarina TaxID=295068 RepID=A0A1A8T9V0_9GAMM|nr:AAA family ATPase [Marinomonas aquimarina]SBS28420.1 hypothetical protein MAQ5080_01089 [Marinomonas aquimarina]
MKKDYDLKVLFGYTPTFEKNTVFINPSHERWNDFGYGIKCEITVLNEGSDSLFTFKAFIGFLAVEIDGDPLDEVEKEFSFLFNHAPEEINGQLKKLKFFTMLPSMGDYRFALDELGPDFFRSVLAKINDVVFYKNSSESWLDKIQKSKLFKLGFMRNSESFFAFHNANSLISEEINERFDGVSNNLKLRFKLDGFDNDHIVNLKYEKNSLIPKRLNILIGKNGLGKSHALRSFCRAALQYSDSNISLTDISSRNDRPMINRLLAISTPGEAQNTFPSERPSTQKMYYRRLILTRNGRSKRSRSINELIIQLVRNKQRIGHSSRWELFTNALRMSMPVHNLVLKTDIGKIIGLLELDRLGGEQASLEIWGSIDTKSEPKFQFESGLFSLSSGQLTFLKFALLCCLHIENGSFVLLDEPETHMHPNMISDFVGLLDQLLEKTGSQALIATHSAYFVREVSREQVHVFKRSDNNEISISSPRLRTFGSDIESISQFVFEEDVDNNLVEKVYSRVKGMSFEQVNDQLSNEVSLSTLLHLKDRMS